MENLCKPTPILVLTLCVASCSLGRRSLQKNPNFDAHLVCFELLLWMSLLSCVCSGVSAESWLDPAASGETASPALADGAPATEDACTTQTDCSSTA